ncbi:MAG: four helix bundle protein [Saprospiraceae bacterium]|jgi:four helix bundle protein|nr:four helix bundle protein [Saprospiraceae bacterium]
MGNFRTLKVYRKAFLLAMDIFQETKKFPPEEKYGLTDQIRRSSRAVCSNIAEGYRKRQYPKHFVSKLSDSDSENSETGVWADFSIACEYIAKEKYEFWVSEVEEIGKMLSSMMKNPEKFLD